MKKNKSNKISLTEATILALQGKLELTEEKEIKNESIEIETDNTEVTVNDDSTVVETPEETITVEKKDTECVDCETPVESEEVIEVPETVEEPVEELPIETEEPVETTSEEVAEEPVEEIETSEDEDLDESKEIKTEDYNTFEDFNSAVKANGGLYNFVANVASRISPYLMKEIALNAIYAAQNDEKIIADIKERVFESKEIKEESSNELIKKSKENIKNKIKEKMENKEQCDCEKEEVKEECNDIDNNVQKTNYRFNESSFTKFISHNLSKKDENFESFKINKFLINENKLKIEDNIDKDIMFSCNPDKIRELLGILLDNAIKHSTKNSKITVNLYKDKNNIILEIKNKGKEITKEDQEKIFDRFYRVDESRNRSDNRYGLGLSIAKNIVTSHNGKISVNCKNGYTTFKVIFKQV